MYASIHHPASHPKNLTTNIQVLMPFYYLSYRLSIGKLYHLVDYHCTCFSGAYSKLIII